MNPPLLLTVYYNEKCPVCDRGVSRQKTKLRLLAQEGVIRWESINAQPEALAAHGVTQEAVRRRLHAMDASNQLLVGADVVAAIARLTSGQEWIGKMLMLPLIRSFAHFAYNGFARLLYFWNLKKRHWRAGH